MSRFSKHSREELLHALAYSREPIRSVAEIDTEDLRAIAEEKFDGMYAPFHFNMPHGPHMSCNIGLPMPPPPPVLTKEEFERINRGVRRLQRKVRILIAEGWADSSVRARRNRRREQVREVTSFIQEAFYESVRPEELMFEGWKRYELVRAIIDENVELRGESTISVDVLRG